MATKQITTTEDLFAALDFFAQNEIPVWVHGGWALDALSGASRDHSDLDLLADEACREKLKQVLGARVTHETSHKLEADLNGAGVDLVLFRRRGKSLYSITPRIVVEWPDDVLTHGRAATLNGRAIPVVSPAALYMEIANKTRKKGPMLEKNARDLAVMEPLLSAEDRRLAERFFPRENTWVNRLRARFGF